MYTLAQHLFGCHRPYPSYPSFLQEQYFLLLMNVIREGKTYRLDTPPSFMEAFFQSDIPDQYLLYEIYLHEVIYYGYMTFNISPNIGGVQL